MCDTSSIVDFVTRSFFEELGTDESEFDSYWFSCCLSSLSHQPTTGDKNAYVCSAREAGRASKRAPDFAMTLAVFRGPGGAVCMG